MGDTRKQIEKIVNKNPGLSFTELKQLTGRSNGVLQYHINESDDLISKKGAIITEYVCSSCDLKNRCGEKCLKKVLRKPKNREIIELKKAGKKNSEIAEEMGLAESTVSYHISKLEQQGLIS